MLMLMILAVVAFFALATIGMVAWNISRLRQSSIRSQHLASANSPERVRLAASQGWQAIGNPPVDFFPNSEFYSVFHRGGTMHEMFHKPIGAVHAYIFNYRFVIRHSKGSTTYIQTVVAFQSPDLNVPYFSLSPEQPLSWLGDALGAPKDIDFPAHPNFSERYTLQSRDETNTRRLFAPPVVAFFENSPTLHVDGGGNYLFIHSRNVVHPIQNLNALVSDGLKILDVLQRSGRYLRNRQKAT